jgi:hypothetical protein
MRRREAHEEIGAFATEAFEDLSRDLTHGFHRDRVQRER